MGVRVSAATTDTRITMVTLHPSCLNMIPEMPVVMVSGRNTATTVRVAAITARPTSLVPYIAASRGPLPRSRCDVMFSSTTIASSTTIPMAIDSELNDMILMEFPVR